MSRIFLSYRRDDSQGYALALFERLVDHFGEDDIFMDVDTIPPGVDFVEHIKEAVGQCNVLIALIGPGWLSSQDASGDRRLSNAEDFVRLEIATALERKIRVIPLLVQGATMPRTEDLPEELHRLARRQALEASPTRFRYDVNRLLKALADPRSDESPSEPSSAEDQANPEQLPPGSIFAGYQIERVLGRGGMGVVYRARQLRPSRTVALKVMATRMNGDDLDGFRMRFESESEVAAAIEHPHVIPIHEVGEEAGVLYIAMRCVEDGMDLRHLIKQEGRLDPRRATRILAQIASALDAAHSRALVHCDVKPANVLIDSTGGVEHTYLTDFGVTRVMDAVAEEGIGTLDYCAPEQFNNEHVDARTDVYALACVLYELLVGEPPFRRDTPAATMFAHIQTPPPRVSEAVPGSPPAMDDVVARGLAKLPASRYASASDLARAAASVVDGRPAPEGEGPPVPADVARPVAGAPPAGLEQGLSPGSEFAGYRIEELVGRGGMGVVYRATHLALGRSVAIKLIAPERTADEAFRKRFTREQRVLARIEHPNVAPVYEVGEHQGVLFIAMRFFAAPTLRDVIQSSGRLTLGRAAAIVVQVAGALDALHREGVVHRSVKPGDVMVTSSGRVAGSQPPGTIVTGSDHVYLIDFGLAADASDTILTKTGQFVGTLNYTAPESIKGDHVGPATDIYSLGCVLYEMVTGEVPYPKDSEVQVLWAHLQEPPPSARRLFPELPPMLDDVIAKAMAKDPHERYRNVGDLADAVCQAAGAT